MPALKAMLRSIGGSLPEILMAPADGLRAWTVRVRVLGRERRRATADAAETEVRGKGAESEPDRTEERRQNERGGREGEGDRKHKSGQQRAGRAMPGLVLAAVAGRRHGGAVAGAVEVRPEHIVNGGLHGRVTRGKGQHVAENGNDGDPGQPAPVIANTPHPKTCRGRRRGRQSPLPAARRIRYATPTAWTARVQPLQ